MTDSKNTGSKMERRDLLKLGTAAAAGFVAKSVMGGETKTMPGLPNNPRTPKAMPTRNLGKTGFQVGIFSLGGQSALEKADNFDVAVPLIETSTRPRYQLCRHLGALRGRRGSLVRAVLR